jgi:hypothetical protein
MQLRKTELHTVTKWGLFQEYKVGSALEPYYQAKEEHYMIISVDTGSHL